MMRKWLTPACLVLAVAAMLTNALWPVLSRTSEERTALRAIKNLGGAVMTHGDMSLDVAGVEFSDARLRQEDLQQLATQLRAVPDLRFLTLIGCDIDWRGLGHFRQVENLEQLTIIHSPIDDVGVARLAELQQLKFVNLSGTGISDADEDHLRSIMGIRLEVVDW